MDEKIVHTNDLATEYIGIPSFSEESQSISLSIETWDRDQSALIFDEESKLTDSLIGESDSARVDSNTFNSNVNKSTSSVNPPNSNPNQASSVHLESIKKFLKIQKGLEKSFIESYIAPSSLSDFNTDPKIPEYFEVFQNQENRYFARFIKKIEPKISTILSQIIESKKSYEELVNFRTIVLDPNVRAYGFNHPAIMKLMGWTIKENRIYYVYEFAEVTLDKFLETKLTPIQLKRVLIGFLNGLKYLHLRSIKYASDTFFMKGCKPVLGFLSIQEEFQQNKEVSFEKDIENLADAFVKTYKIHEDPSLVQIIERMKAESNAASISRARKTNKESIEYINSIIISLKR